MRQTDDEAPKWVIKFYMGLWTVLKILAIIAFIAGIIYIRIGFDKWYINLLKE